MPGTGKTFTIAQIIKHILSRKKSVLITSYTHSAVDNILLKLIDLGIDFVRLGNPSKIHPKVLPYTLLDKNTSVQGLHDFFESKWVIATTCLGTNHFLFSKRSFDYCIVDEASQISIPACIGPLRYADKFVLVGDPYQLPPLVKSKQAIKERLGISLFKLLSESHPQSVVSLSFQYRMNKDIMALSNTLIYNNRLKCGTFDLSVSTLALESVTEYLHSLHSLHSSQNIQNIQNHCWISQLLNIK